MPISARLQFCHFCISGIKRKAKIHELIRVSEQCYYIQAPANIRAVQLDDADFCLIDSGNDKDAKRKIRMPS